MSIPVFNKNNLVLPNRYNRGYDTKFVDGTTTPVSIGLYTIDNAILKYLQTKIRPIVTQDGKQIQVPVIYGNPERWKSVQRDGNIRDQNGKIMLPIIMMTRSSLKKNEINSSVNKYHTYTFRTGWNSRNIYDRFAAVNKVIPSEMLHVTVMPDFYDVTYDCIVWTEYMEQMNNLVENISFESNEYWGESNNYKFRASISDFNTTTELPSTNDRMVRTKFAINVKAYLLPKSALDRNGNRSTTTKMQYSIKKVVFDAEFVTGSR